MTDSTGIERAIGRLEGKVDTMEVARRERDGAVDDRLDGVEERLGRIEVELRAVHEVLDKAKGGWKVLIVVGGIAGAVASWVVPTFLKKLLGM